MMQNQTVEVSRESLRDAFDDTIIDLNKYEYNDSLEYTEQFFELLCEKVGLSELQANDRFRITQ